MNHLNKLVSNELVYGLSKLKFEKEHVCEACQRGKQTRKSFPLKNCVSTSKPFELLLMDLFGPSRTMSLGGNLYESCPTPLNIKISKNLHTYMKH